MRSNPVVRISVILLTFSCLLLLSAPAFGQETGAATGAAETTTTTDTSTTSSTEVTTTTCVDYSTQTEAQTAYSNGATQLDVDGDGQACQSEADKAGTAASSATGGVAAGGSESLTGAGAVAPQSSDWELPAGLLLLLTGAGVALVTLKKK